MGLKVESERRGKDRVDITQDIVVKEVGSGNELGRLANIHGDGLMLIGSLEVEDGSVFNVSLSAGESEVVGSINIESLWSSKTDTGEQYWVGFQILHVDAGSEESFASLVGKFDK